jgi:F-type H+-transporting ATPase subunit epsilon
MPDKIELEVVTPDRRVLSAMVDDVILPSVDGYLGVLPGHAPLLCRLAVGELSYLSDGKRHYLTVSGGYAEVLRESVRILADTSERAEEIDLDRAEKAKQRAERKLKADQALHEFQAAEVRLKRAINRIQVHGRRAG